MKVEEGLALIRGMEQYQIFIVLGLAVAVLLFGYKIKKTAFFIAWFILGYLLMQYLLPLIKDWLPDVANNDLFRTLLPLGGGAIMALLGFSIEKLCVGGICFALTILMTVTEFGTAVPTLIIGAVVGAVLAGLAVALMKPATIVATSAVGSYALTLGLLVLIPDISPNPYYWVALIGFAALGIVFQFLTTKRG